MIKLLMIFAGGGLGSLCRYSIGAALLKNVDGHFPWATFAANAIGCLCIGLLAGYFERRQAGLVYMLLVTGFCGGFTTFSTFSNESVQLMRQGFYSLALGYMALSMCIGLMCTASGFWAAKNI